MNRQEYITAFKSGSLNRPAVLHPTATLEQLHELLRELGNPRTRLIHSELDYKVTCQYELLVVFDHCPTAVDRYYHARELDGLGTHLPNLLLIAEGTEARGAVRLGE